MMRLLAPVFVLLLAGTALGQVCGNAVVEAGEDCDDGNTTSGDGCSATCLFEGCALTGSWHSSNALEIEWTLVEAPDGGTITGMMWPTGITIQPFATAITGSRTGSAVAINRDGTVYAGTMHECDAVSITSASGTFDLVRIRSTYCGDGTVQPPYETCDPLAPGNGPGGCDIDCL